MLTDSHVHLDDSRFDGDRDQVIARARDADVKLQIIPGVDKTSWPRIRALCDDTDGLHPAYGLHPIFLNHHRPDHVDALGEWLQEHRAVAVGEIGLDFYVEGLGQDKQRDYFSRQLSLAREMDLPVIVHARKALQEVTLTLRKFDGLRGVVHSFSGSQEQARQLFELGFHIGIGGPVTYERAKRLHRVVSSMPLEFLLLETDAPDQPLCGHQGQRNEPERVREVLQSVARLRDEAPDVIARTTTANAKKLFGLS